MGYGTSTTSETGLYSSMQEKDTQQLCRMSFLKVHRLFSAPKFDKEPKNKDIFRIVDFGNILVLIEKGAVTEM